MSVSMQNPDQPDDGWLAEINTTPLVDVMLVLLIIFLLTIPVVSASVKLQLPVQSARQQDTSVDYVIISVDAKGRIFLNDAPMPDVQTLAATLAPAMAKTPKPQLHLRADGGAPYASVSPVIDMAQSLGLAQLSLLTEQSPAAKPQRGAQGKVGELAP